MGKLSNVVNNEVVKKTVYNELVKNVNTVQTIDTIDLVKIADYDTEIVKIEKKMPGHDRYITTNDFNKLSGVIFDERLKQAKLATTNDLGTVDQGAIKNEEKIEKLQTFHLSFFIGKSYFSDDGSQNFLMFQPFYKTSTMPAGLTHTIKEWESTGLSNEKIEPLCTANNNLSPKL